jgi:site-specific DNA recombinase
MAAPERRSHQQPLQPPPMSNPASEPDLALAVSYAAKSSPDDHDSLPDQQAAIRRRAEHELRRLIVAEFAEANRSGWRGNRGPQLEAAIARAVELAATHDVVELWVWHSTRLGRGSGLKGEARSLLELFAYLRRRGVTMRSVDDDQFVTSPMLVGFAAELAEKYSADLSTWVTAGKDRQFERGDWIGGPIPDGYLSDGEKGLRLDPERAPIIRRIVDRALEGIACAVIARELNADGVRTRNGRPWIRRRIQDTLSNAVYAGQIVRWRATPREQRRPGRHPALMTLDEFARVAEHARRRDVAAAGRAAGGRPSRRFLLATLAHCSRCGGRMYSRTSTYRRKDGTRARFYQCGHVGDATGLCDAPNVPAAAVDEQVLERLPRYIEAAERWLRELGSDRQRAEGLARAEVDRAERDVRERRARVSSLADRYQLEAEGDLSTAKAEALLDALVEARGELKQAERRARRADAELAAVHRAIDGDALAVAYQALRDALRTGETSSVAEFNYRLRQHFDAFVIGKDVTPVPIWKVEAPRTLAAGLTPTGDDTDISAFIERRVAELGLLDDREHMAVGSHAYLWMKWNRPALAASHGYAERGPRSSSVA